MAEKTVTQDGLIYTLSSDGTYYSVKPENKSSITTANILAEISGIPVTTIGSSAFGGCSLLTSINIPNSVTTIGSSAFSKCSLLTSINIPNSVTTIWGSAFYQCTALETITIPNSVTSIGTSTFYNCKALTSITIPDSVTSIGSYSFSGCSGLTSVTIGNGVTSIEGSAFDGCNALTSITVDPDNTVYKSDGNCIIEKATNTLIRGCKTSIIPNYVTSIGSDAFYGCHSLTSINIPDSVTSIDTQAFYGCFALTSINIPDSVATIGTSTFYNCKALKTVILGKGLETLYGTSTSDGSFRNCTALTTVINKSENLVTPNDDYPFYGCDNLTKIYFTSTTAGYVDGGTWCGRTLVYIESITTTLNLLSGLATNKHVTIGSFRQSK